MMNWIGKSARFEVNLQEVQLDAFARLTGDRNPIHMSVPHARERGHPHRVAHGLLVSGFVSRLVGEFLPGGDVMILSLKVSFHRAAYAGDLLEVHGVVVQESPATRTLEIEFQISKPNALVCKGTVLVQIQTSAVK